LRSWQKVGVEKDGEQKKKIWEQKQKVGVQNLFLLLFILTRDPPK
jgi:hypothetical protein